ncbi:MAG: class I lanthipeptide [Candidatus Aminicenantes bacterium]|nr:class I lanthipeptide [Candidatus Aminicenantes bacterium]
MKKLSLNKKTIANLTKQELSEIKAGYKPCWENLWTMYHCDLFYTGTPEAEGG